MANIPIQNNSFMYDHSFSDCWNNSSMTVRIIIEQVKDKQNVGILKTRKSKKLVLELNSTCTVYYMA